MVWGDFLWWGDEVGVDCVLVLEYVNFVIGVVVVVMVVVGCCSSSGWGCCGDYIGDGWGGCYVVVGVVYFGCVDVEY